MSRYIGSHVNVGAVLVFVGAIVALVSIRDGIAVGLLVATPCAVMGLDGAIVPLLVGVGTTSDEAELVELVSTSDGTTVGITDGLEVAGEIVVRLLTKSPSTNEGASETCVTP
jgi:hypothetical protein